jgi:hypothetical protein
MATPSKALLVLPTPAQVDALALSYDKAKEKLLDAVLAAKAAQDELDLLKEPLVDLASKFGSVHGSKSKLLHGLKWEMMLTEGTSTSIDSAAVERMRLHLLNVGQTRLLKRLFESDTRWTLKSTARAEILKPDIGDDVRANFAACEVTKPSTPKLEVRQKK